MDDLQDARRTIRAFLNFHSFRVCGEAADGKEAIRKVRDLKPDIVLLDIHLPGMNGVRTAGKIRLISPETIFVFLTIHKIPGTVHTTRRWSDGFVSKSAAGTELIPTLCRVAGERDQHLDRAMKLRSPAMS